MTGLKKLERTSALTNKTNKRLKLARIRTESEPKTWIRSNRSINDAMRLPRQPDTSWDIIESNVPFVDDFETGISYSNFQQVMSLMIDLRETNCNLAADGSPWRTPILSTDSVSTGQTFARVIASWTHNVIISNFSTCVYTICVIIEIVYFIRWLIETDSESVAL